MVSSFLSESSNVGMAVSVASVALENKSNRCAASLAGKIGKKAKQVTNIIVCVI